MEHGEGDFDAGLLLRLVDVHRNTAAVIDDGDRIVGMDRDVDRGRETRQRLVDGVVYDFVDQMVQSARGDGADVHRGTAPHRLEALEDLDRVGLVAAVVFFFLRCRRLLLRHQFPNVREATGSS